ncbi:MAG: hypothetical protein N4A70_19015 [Pelagimonas sp.]|jgi:hypothetical protein|nr:hypothetical protein [Pelagimonas sp.]
MTIHSTPRGGAAVGLLKELTPIEVSSVIYLRLWSEDATTQAQLNSEFIQSLGLDQGMTAIEALGDMAYIIARHGSRPMMRHAIGCKCLGSDEACFAQLVALASAGETREAQMMAALMTRPTSAEKLVNSAVKFGRALERMADLMPMALMQSPVPQAPRGRLH